METKQVWGVCAECGRYHENPVRKAVEEPNFEHDIAALLKLMEEIQVENRELNTTVEIMQRELYDARQQLEITNLQLRVAQLEKTLVERKSAKFDDSPWDESEEQLEESIWLHNLHNAGHR